MSKSGRVCQYISPYGWKCDQPVDDKDLCYWHDPEIDKSHHHIKEELEGWARAGRPMDGFKLARANLKEVDLVNHGSKKGFQCHNADFYRADLTDANLFGLDLRGSSFMKATLKDVNMHCANVEGCDFLGADLTRARLENVEWGKYIKQEKQAQECFKRRQRAQAYEYLLEAEEVYRNIHKQCEKQGLYEQAGIFFKREMRLRRLQMPLFSFTRIMSKIVDLICGYGEEPMRLVLCSILLILSCACVYFVLDTTSASPLYENMDGALFYVMEFLNAIYFSIVTFTTLGYGDISPVGIARFVAALEAFLGSFMMALFVVVFVKKMTR